MRGTARGTVLLATGRAEFIEKYEETAQALLNRGFRVVGFDWRNQGLSDRPLPNRQVHHLTDFALLAEDLDAVYRRVAAPLAEGGPVVLMAHSMGGLAATLHLARYPARYAAAVLSAPMYDIVTGPWPRGLVRRLADLFTALGRGERYAFGQGDYNPVEGIFTPSNSITSDPARYAAFHGPYRDRPELRVGGVSFGWLKAALAASDAVRSTVPLSEVTTPVLLLNAPEDAVVSAAAIRAVAARFGDATLREYPGAKHELLMERDEIRDRVWADIDAFLEAPLDKALAAPAPVAVR